MEGAVSEEAEEHPFPVGTRVMTTLLAGGRRRHGKVVDFDPDPDTPYHWLVEYDDGWHDWWGEDEIVREDV